MHSSWSSLWTSQVRAHTLRNIRSLHGFANAAASINIVEWVSLLQIVIVAKGESSDTYYAAVDDINISSKRCVRSPPHSAPGTF